MNVPLSADSIVVCCFDGIALSLKIDSKFVFLCRFVLIFVLNLNVVGPQ